MDTCVQKTLADRLDALQRVRAEQDDELARTGQILAAMGHATVSVDRRALQAIDEACLVSLPTLTPALRG